MTKVLAAAAAAASSLALLLAPAAASAETVVLTANLSGANEVGANGTGAGAPDGNGAFRAEINSETGDFCYTLYAEKTAAPTMAHLHTGAAGTNGGPVITLEITGKGSDMCIAVEPEKLKPILADPAGFYVNIHNADFPAGAVRGQLAKG